MNILGITFLTDASAAIVRDGELVAAVSEERLNRQKLWHGMPYGAVAEVLRLSGLTMDGIDLVATHGLAPSEPERGPYEAMEARINASQAPAEVKERQTAELWKRYEHERMVQGTRTPAYLEQVHGLGRPVLQYGHHEAHAATA